MLLFQRRGANTRNWKCCNYSNSGAGHTCLQSVCDTWSARLRSERQFRNLCCRKDFFIIWGKTGLLTSEGLFVNNFQLKWLRPPAARPEERVSKTSCLSLLLAFSSMSKRWAFDFCVGFGPSSLGILLTMHDTWNNSKMWFVFFSFLWTMRLKDK